VLKRAISCFIVLNCAKKIFDFRFLIADLGWSGREGKDKVSVLPLASYCGKTSTIVDKWSSRTASEFRIMRMAPRKARNTRKEGEFCSSFLVLGSSCGATVVFIFITALFWHEGHCLKVARTLWGGGWKTAPAILYKHTVYTVWVQADFYIILHI
jgi:hypothetical protein